MPRNKGEQAPYLPDMEPEGELPSEPKKEESKPRISIDPRDRVFCQYCQDTGPCTYCKRGRIEGEAEKRGGK